MTRSPDLENDPTFAEGYESWIDEQAEIELARDEALRCEDHRDEDYWDNPPTSNQVESRAVDAGYDSWEDYDWGGYGDDC